MNILFHLIEIALLFRILFYVVPDTTKKEIMDDIQNNWKMTQQMKDGIGALSDRISNIETKINNFFKQ